MKKIFISQDVLDRLFNENKADLMGDKLTIRGKDTQVYLVSQAYKFLAVADGSPDNSGLVGKIYAKAELDKIQADIYMDSAIIKDTPYTIEPGYIGVPENATAEAVAEKAQAEQKIAPKEEPPTQPEAEKQQPAGTQDDTAMLTDYLLKIL